MTRKFLEPDDYQRIRRMISDGQQLTLAHSQLMAAQPVPAVLYELLRIARIHARQAADARQWQDVLDIYQGYTQYAAASAPYCLRTVNQEPPALSARDQALLDRARSNSHAPVVVS